jgi:hypothetical protein
MVSYDSATQRIVELRVWPPERDQNSMVMPGTVKKVDLKTMAPNKSVDRYGLPAADGG